MNLQYYIEPIIKKFRRISSKINILHKASTWVAMAFYQRKEIKDVLSYTQITINKKDTEALLRIINYPASIGKQQFHALRNT